MKDRLSVHIDNGQSSVREAVTILRNGGQASQSGLVGITNATYMDGGSPTVPATIFNVQSTGDSNIRFSSGPSKKSHVELLGNGNQRASGLLITYDPTLDNAYVIGPGYGGHGDHCVDPNGGNNPVVDFSLIRASGSEGAEFSHITLAENGYVGVGLTRRPNDAGNGYDRRVYPHAPLTVSYDCHGHSDSGTISMHEQASSPATYSNFGKIFVKPFTTGGRTQALFFKDDGGNETNLVLSQDLEPSVSTDGLIFGHNGNTYGGWHTPKTRPSVSNLSNNTYYGWGAGYQLNSETISVTDNTLIGRAAGSGLTSATKNTVVGSNSLTNYSHATNNVILGDNNLVGSTSQLGSIDDCVLLGRDLYNLELPADKTLAIGVGDTPIISGDLNATSRSLFFNSKSLSIQEGAEFKITDENDVSENRRTRVVSVVDDLRVGTDNPKNDLKFNFENGEDVKLTLLRLDPFASKLTNVPTYQIDSDPNRPYAELQGDFKIQGAIRFADETSMSGLSHIDLLPLATTSGINKKVEDSTNRLVLDYSNLKLASQVSSNILSDNTFIAVQTDGTNSSSVAKMSIQGFAAYVSDQTDTMAENCNVLITKAEQRASVNVAEIYDSVLIGCNVAQRAKGWRNAVIIGSNAGTDATTDTAISEKGVIFIGHNAGNNADSITNSIFIGQDAGNAASEADKSVFIGVNAGQRANTNSSIAIGFNALRGNEDADVDENNQNNIEIITGKDDNERLMYQQTLSDRLNIQNTIAGTTNTRNISIGDARLSPTAPLEVRKDSTIHAANSNDYIQTWYCDDTLVASVDCDGVYKSHTNTGLIVEGTLNGSLSAGDYTTPSTQILTLRGGGTVTVSNRDSGLTGLMGAYVVAIKIGSEYRPIWVGAQVFSP